MTRPSDQNLLDAYRKGDPRAFTVLIDRYQGVLLRYARGLCGAAGGGADAEDLVQETFLRLARNPPAPLAEPPRAGAAPDPGRNGGGAFASWLFRVLRNHAVERQRSESRRRARERSLARHEAVPGEQPVVEQDDTLRAVRRELDHLPFAQREVVLLKLAGGRTYREIAAVTGRPAGTVAWLMSEGLKRLSRCLRPALEPGPGCVPANRCERRGGQHAERQS